LFKAKWKVLLRAAFGKDARRFDAREYEIVLVLFSLQPDFVFVFQMKVPEARGKREAG
jgi:hypothetical protein